MRISDWSSDVCSSDLRTRRQPGGLGHSRRHRRRGPDVEMVESESKRREEGSLINRVRNTDMSTWKYMLLTAAFAAPPPHAQEAATAAVAPGEARASDRIDAARRLNGEMMPAAQRAAARGQQNGRARGGTRGTKG